MIQSFAERYKQHIAWPLLVVFYLQTIIFPLCANAGANICKLNYTETNRYPTLSNRNNINRENNNHLFTNKKHITAKLAGVNPVNNEKKTLNAPEKSEIGGPASPESMSFKAVGSDNLVNLFTGDFSYSIPLLDVGGYPVNLFYSAGISMEQEASWVGLGWNINPGTVSRNMRGVPDDFNGEDKLVQTQNVKPNRTWGGEVGVDGELIGIKQPKVNFSLGYSYNNYLGPALELGAGISLTIPMTESTKNDKSAPKVDSGGGIGSSGASLSLNAKLNSRSGLTFSPSLNLNLPISDKKASIGVGLSTSYNSRTGIKELNISSQMSSYRYQKNEAGFYDKNNSVSLSAGIASSTISFARPSYIPTLRMPMQYANYSGQVELGGGMFGVRGAAHAQGYYSESKIPSESKVVYKPLVGFMYSEKANGNVDAVMDFNRLNDAEVTPRTPILSAPQYAYDIFSIQGEGTGGNIRAYRGDLGFMRDNETKSKDNNFSIGADIAPPGHFGLNWNIIHTPTRVGGWEDGNNTLRQTLAFKGKMNNTSFENIYFRNPGEATVTNINLIDRIGGDNLVRFKLSGSNTNPRLESRLEQFNKNTLAAKGELSLDNSTLTGRDKRTQVTTMLTAQEAAEAGLEKTIRNYTGNFNPDTTIQYTSISRTEGFRKPHHISEIDVLEQTGMRYVYGLPVYSIKQKDFTFSVGSIGDPATGIVNFTGDEPTVGSRHMENKGNLDGYMMAQETPAYASAFLLTGLLSPDYVDVNNDGITEDDLGGAVKFDYQKSPDVHKWRTPRNNTTAATAHFNEGLKSEKKDNKATISYGEREVWYLSSIESKSMIAIFKTATRDDAKGVTGELDGRKNAAENANRRLDTIHLYNKAEIKAKGIAVARPIKSVIFLYDYSLCSGTPDNANGGGKLTLKSVYFSYNGQPRANKDKYVFNYGNTASQVDNPSYANNASDKWGTFKKPNATDSAANPGGLTNADYPYTSNNKTRNDEYAAAWSLKKILLPSGGQMEISYEADDYAYVQNRRACNMFNIYGLGNSTNSSTNNGLYNPGLPFPVNAGTSTDNFYVYIKLPKGLQNTDAAKQKQEIWDKYLDPGSPDSKNHLAFKLLINMPKGPEPLTVYANYDDYGLCTNSTNKDIIYIKLRPVDGKSPLSKSAIGFITENLPGQAFDGYEVEVDGVKAFLEMMEAMLVNIKNAFKDVDEQMRSASPPRARTIVLDKSFVRLDNPAKMKYGGGLRVKKVIVKDNWQKMLTANGGTTYGFTSTYGQEYDYSTTEKINGKDTLISSGVASYETGLGSEENPFREIVSFNNKMPLASAQYGAIEMPMLEGLFPSPGVGYSKITVRSIHRKGTHGDSTLRSAIGKQVTEFYTAREFPVYTAYTPMSNKDHHFNSFFNFLYKEITDRRVTSQGFLVETNDMHGKMKSQTAYSESDEKTPLSYSYHTYKNTGKNGLNDKVDFVYNDQGGAVIPGNMGIDMELMTDVREFRVQSKGFNGQIQTDFFTYVPFPIFIIPMLPLKSYTENKYRAVTCTKLINYHAIEDSVIVMDKGSVISTRTIAYDAESGAPIVTKTANEFNDPLYNVNYPAYWAYSGMSLAYKNIDRQFSDINFLDGRIQNITQADQNKIFESGDELYITKQGPITTPECITISADVTRLWAFDTTKNSTALTVPDKYFVFMDSAGNVFSKGNVSFRIIRSGKRNLPGNSVAGATTMANPIAGGILTVNGSSKTVAASAMEFKEKWQTDNDVFKKYKTITNISNPPELVVNGDFSAGNIGFTSDYTYSPGQGTGAGQWVYNVGNNVPYWNPSWDDCSDHTGFGGNMMMVNPGNNPQYAVWKKTVAVEPNTIYDLSAWGTKLSANSPADLHFYINGSQVGSNLIVNNFECIWSHFTATWNSGNNTSAEIKILDSNPDLNGNDFAIDDISFKAQPECSTQEVEDCNGYLEKKINPYVKGLIGNYRGHRGMVFYGERIPVPVTPNATDIRKDGYLSDFAMYWNFNGSSNLVPDISNSKWVWNSQNLKYNSKGLELETKDALNIYTAAQYGFNKTQPVAIANNSRYNEMFGEGFEDYGFNERINSGTTNNCAKKHIDFSGLNNSQIINTDQAGFKAHSGKYVLGINGTSSKLIEIKNDDVYNFNMAIENDAKKILNNPGGNHGVTQEICYYGQCFPSYLTQFIDYNNYVYSYPDLWNQGLYVSYGNLSASKSWVRQTWPWGGEPCNPDYLITPGVTTQYIEITQPGTYQFSITQRDVFLNNNAYTHENYFTERLILYNQDATVLYGVFDGPSNVVKPPGNVYTTESSVNHSIFLSCPGIYKVHFLVYQKRLNTDCFDRVESSYSFNQSLISYADLSNQNGCTYTKPIAAKDSMLNPLFSIPTNKKMLFSAWVRETCSATPCTKTDYTNSNIEIWSGGTNLGATTIKRRGAIIEGWQKIEGEFTVPSNATDAEIRFINTNDAAMYVDDIRIHPFNSNMKTFAYDPRTLRLAAELDQNNYASFYEYDEEGQLVRVKKETSQGIKTINETRASKQKVITDLQ